MTNKKKLEKSYITILVTKAMTDELKNLDYTISQCNRTLVNYLCIHDQIPVWLQPYLTKEKQAEIEHLYPDTKHSILVIVKRERLAELREFEIKHHVNRQLLAKGFYYYCIVNGHFPNDVLFYEEYVKNML